LCHDANDHLYIISSNTSKSIKKLPVVQLSYFDLFKAVGSLLFFFGTLTVAPLILFCSCYFVIFHQSPLGMTLLMIYLVLTLYPKQIHAWPYYIEENPMWKYWRGYFSFHLVIPDSLIEEPNTRFIFSEHPHGIFPMGQWMSQSIYRKCFPNWRYCKGVTTDSCLKAPVIRQLYGWYGLISAKRESMEEQLINYNIAVIPGGIAEMYYSKMDEEILFLQERKGFLRIALTEGCDIIPCYVFGNNQILKRISTGNGLLEKASRKLRTTITWVYGYYGTPIPYRHQIVLAFGSPVKVKKNENPSDEDVENLKIIYIESIRRVFDEHKHLLGWQHKSLKII